MSEIKVDSIRTYTTNPNGIAFPNGLYVGNNVIRPNNTIQSTDFTSTNIGGAGYAIPLTVNSMTSKGYVDNLVNSLLNTAGLSGVSKAYVDTNITAAQTNAQTYADNNFMDKNGNTEHKGGGLTFSGGPYTFTPGSSTPIQIASPLPAILFNETDVAGVSGSIGVDGGILKLVYGGLSGNTKGLSIFSDGKVQSIGAMSIGGNLSVTGSASVVGNLSVTGNAFFTNGLTAKNLTVTNDLTVNNNLTVIGDLTVGSGSLISGFIASSYTPAIAQTHYTKVKAYYGNFREEIPIDVLDTIITPRKTNSKILVSVHLSGEFRYSENVVIRLYRVANGVETSIGSPTTTLGPTIQSLYGYDWNAGAWGAKPTRVYSPNQAGSTIGTQYASYGPASPFVMPAGIKSFPYDNNVTSTMENLSFQYLDDPQVSAGTPVTYKVYITGFNQAGILDRLYLNVTWTIGYDLLNAANAGYNGSGPDTYQVGPAPGNPNSAGDMGYVWERSTSSMILQEFFV